ncbi:MAG: sigma-70 family RNA polymerase sigma factor [Oscillospiraceae bacterium]|nr:sigma-70 family RNA polymerase sigma factor [Oscillospiraceae bacterium]
MLEDTQILLLLKNAPETGLWELTKKYGGLVKMLIGRILPMHAQDVEECVADTFIRIWKNCESITVQNGSIKGYVVCAARSIAIDRYRKLKRERRADLDEELLPTDETMQEMIELQADVDIVHTMIQEMNAVDREIFTRRYLLFESIKEVALHLNMGEKAVESRLFRGRKQLKLQLQERGVTV